MSLLSQLIYGSSKDNNDNNKSNEKNTEKKQPRFSVGGRKLKKEDLFGSTTSNNRVDNRSAVTTNNNDTKTDTTSKRHDRKSNHDKSSSLAALPSVKSTKEIKKERAAQRKKKKEDAQAAWLKRIETKKVATVEDDDNNDHTKKNDDKQQEDDEEDPFADFEELDPDEIGSLASSSVVIPWKPSEKWKALIRHQSAFVSTLYAQPPKEEDRPQNKDEGSRSKRKKKKKTLDDNDENDEDANSSTTLSQDGKTISKSPLFHKNANQEKETDDLIEVLHETLHPQVVETLAKSGLLPPRDEQLQPRLVQKRKRGGRARRRLATDHHHIGGHEEDAPVIEEYQETVEQARLRVAKYERNLEWRSIRKRWKQRRYDYASAAVDVGNAVQYMAQHVVEQRYQEAQAEQEYQQRRRSILQQRQQQQETPDLSQDGRVQKKRRSSILNRKVGDGYTAGGSDDKVATSERKVAFEEDDDDDSSVDEQKQVLQRLQQNTASQEEIVREQAGENEFGDQLELFEEPFENSMDFWKMGLSGPRPRDLLFRYSRTLLPLKPPMTNPVTTTAENRKPPPSEDSSTPTQPTSLLTEPKRDITMKIGQYKSKTGNGSKGIDPRCYFPLSANRFHRTRFVSVSTDFLLHRQMRSLAARYLCGSGGCGTSPRDGQRQTIVQNRFLRALHTMVGQTDGRRTSFAFPDTHRKQLHLFMARQRGYDFQCYIQHKWKQDGRHYSSWADIAREFGLSRRDHSNPARWSGRSLQRTAIRLNTQSARKKILRANKTAKLEWAPPSDEDREYDGYAEPAMKIEQAPADTSRDNDEAQTYCVESLLAPTTDGVIGDSESVDRTSVSEEAMAVATSCPPARNNQELLGDRTTNYVHLTGTVPPIPMFPLNPTGVVFGPVDRYVVFHHTAKVDETTVALTISTLVARIGATTVKAAKLANYQFHEDDERKRINDQLQLYVEQVPDLHRVNYFKWLLTTKNGIQDLPLVNYYNGVMSYCSFMANGCSLRTAVKREQESSGTVAFGRQFEENDEDDSLYGNDEDGIEDSAGMENVQGWDSSYLAGFGMEKIAERISDYCQKHIRHNGLLRFPALHLTFGLACLCRRLPSAVAEILSRSLYEEPKPNTSHCRTPVELIQQALEYMEDNRLLEEDEPNFDSEDGAVQAALLEYWMYEAADVFRQCFKLEPVAVEYHLWYIGALSGCLLLCSGNRIGSGARRCPSEWNRNVVPFDVTFDGDDAPNPSPSHEIRSKLPKYELICEELRHAVHLLLQNAKYQKSWAKMHLAVSSVLEWKQVIALLVGSSDNHSSQGDDPWSQVRLLHRYHVSQWVLQDHSPSAQEYASRLAHHANNNNALLSLRASAVENDPGNVEHWRMLVYALGPIGRPSESLQDRMHKRHCRECSRLREMRVVDHDAHSGPNRRGRGWWAADRVSWWDSCLLEVPSVSPPHEWQIITESVDRKLEASIPRVIDSHVPMGGIAQERLDCEAPLIQELSWLIGTGTGNEAASPASPSARERSFDTDLPRTFRETCASDLEMEKPMDTPKLTGPNAHELELLCYKIVVTCHMYSVARQNIDATLWGLVDVCWAKGKFSLADCDEWTALLWLSSRGLDISQCLRQGYPTPSRLRHDDNMSTEGPSAGVSAED